MPFDLSCANVLPSGSSQPHTSALLSVQAGEDYCALMHHWGSDEWGNSTFQLDFESLKQNDLTWTNNKICSEKPHCANMWITHKKQKNIELRAWNSLNAV